MAIQRYYRLGMAPFTPILSGLIFTDRKEATRRARDENKCGEFRGRGIKVSPCTYLGELLVGGKK